MKKIFTLVLCMLQCLLMFAAEPTVPSSNFIFSSIDGAKFTIRFTQGNGANRIVVMKAGSAVTGLPVNGSEYTANAAFGTAGSAFTAANEYVIYKGNSNTFTVSNLTPATVYYLSVFEYNGSNASTQYLMVSLNGSQATISAPLTQTNTISVSAITGNSGKLNWINGSGEGRLIIARKAAAVNASPADLTDYSASSDFSFGSVLNSDNYVVYKASGSTLTVNNLEPNTTYHFAFFERNGSSTPVYLRPGAITSFTTNAGPTVQTQSFSFSNQEGNRFTINSGRGNGSRRLYIIKKGSPVTAVPVNGRNYTSNTAFGSGEEIAPGEFVINNSTEAVVIATNLEPATVYHFRSFEFDIDAAGNTYYLTSSPANGSYSTATAPSPVSGINFINVTGNSMTIRYTAGNGGYRMVMMKEGAPVDGVPENLRRYNGNGSFGNGDIIPTGNYVVNGGANGTSTNVVNLRPGFTYHIAVYEFSGNNYPIYGPAVTTSITMPAEPIAASTNFSKTLIEGNSFRASWNNGDGTRRIVIARKNAAVTAVPVDGVTYTANTNFGSGTAIAADQFVVYDGISSTCDVKNLEIGATYHLAVYEYNSPGGTPDYLTSAWLSGNATTLIAPTTQLSAITASNIQANSVSLGYVAGNGTSRLFIMRAGGPVNIDPTDLISYSASSVYGNQEIGSGNYIVQKATNTANFAVTGLAANTTYHVAAFELNGVNGPVYKRPAAVASFTTTSGSGVVAPTLPATAPLFTNTDGNKLTFKCTEGNGTYRLIVARAGSPVNFQPSNGTTYAADAVFGNGTDVGANEFVVFNGSGNTVAISNLNHSTNYYFTVYEYNGSGSNTRYLTSSTLAANASTLTAPAVGSTNANKSFTSNSITLTWQNGTGSSRMVILKEGAAVSSFPANLSAYPASNVFGNGAQVASGEYVVYSGSGNNVTVTGLTANKTYYFSIIEYNGSTGPVYNTLNALTGNATTSVALPVTWLYFTATINNDQVLLKWGTASEQQSAYFIIEKNTGSGFVTIGNITAAGNSVSDKHYTYTDQQPGTGAVLYRLKQVDIDGRFTYSNVASVQFNAAQKPFSFFPNPATTSIRVSLAGNIQKTKLWIYDNKGSLVMQQQLTSNTTTIDLSSLKSGVYYVVVDDGQKRTSEKLIKQ